MSRQILNGWKQISNHIERGVRTAQRWEALLGMPVHRPALKDRSAVVAFADELDGWLCRTSPAARDQCLAIHDPGENTQAFFAVLDNMSALVRQSRELICRLQRLQQKLRRPVTMRRPRMASRPRVRAASAPGRGRGAVLMFRRRQRGQASGLRLAGLHKAGLAAGESLKKAR
jgi:hypothetical protein